MAVIEEQAPRLGFSASVSFAISPGPGPDEALARDILAVTREALFSCARHAHATAVTVALTLHNELVTLDIADNGHGPGPPARSGDLVSVRHRAEANGGTLQITDSADGGTRIAWTARVGRT